VIFFNVLVRDKNMKLKLSRTFLFGILAFSILIAFAVAYFLYIPASDNSYVPQDSVYYKKISLEYCEAPFSPILNVFNRVSLLNLNWTTIVSIGAFLCEISPIHQDLLIFIANIIVLYLTLYFYYKILTKINASTKQFVLFNILFCLQTYLIVILVSLNKDIYSYLVVAVFLYLYVENRIKSLLLVGIFFGLLKVQFLIIAFFLAAKMLRVRAIYLLLGVSIVLPLINYIFEPSMLNADVYFSRYQYEIRTENIAKILNQITLFPFGYIISLPLRALITALSGFSPFRIVAANNLLSILYQITALMFSCFSILLFWKFIKYKFKECNLLTNYLFCYLLILCIVPFFQLRYFIPLLPVLMIMLLMKKNQWLKYA